VEFPLGLEGPLPRQADVVVVGSGYTGMAAAREAAGRGREVVVLEAESLGWGASTRNAGMVHPGFKVSVAKLVRMPGGRSLYRSSVDAYQYVRDVIDSEAIECGFVDGGQLHLAPAASHARALRETGRLYREALGVDAKFFSPADLGNEVSCSGFQGGLLVATGGGLQPAQYWAGLARAALSRGVRAFDHVRAQGWEPDGAGVRVATTRGDIRARDVIIATNGYSDAFDPWVRRRVIPISSFVIATVPLPPELSRSLVQNSRMVITANNFLSYWRTTGDGRLLFGGRTSFAPTSLATARNRLYSLMVCAYPQLQGVEIDRSWGGNVGFTLDRMPHVGRRGPVAYAVGCCGSGIALGSHLGAGVGAWVAGEDPPVLAEQRFPAVPGYAGRPWFLPMAGWYYQVRDHLDARGSRS
jgi:glycine/D-amino acid oxidase-like deaminating enzyme